MATVRCTWPADMGAGPVGAAAGPLSSAAGGGSGTYENRVIFRGWPSCRIWKSSLFRPGTWRPDESVTTASTCTCVTVMRRAGGAAGPV